MAAPAGGASPPIDGRVCNRSRFFHRGAREAATDPNDPSGAAAEITAPVEIDGNVLFRLRGISALPAAERAARVTANIVSVADDSALRTEDLHVVESGDYLRIMAGDRPVVNLVEADAELERVSLRALADVDLLRIARAIEEYRDARKPERLLQGGLRALVATVALIVAIGAALWLARHVSLLLDRRFRRRIKSFEIQSFEFVRAEQIWGGLRALLRVIAALTILGLGFFYLE